MGTEVTIMNEADGGARPMSDVIFDEEQQQQGAERISGLSNSSGIMRSRVLGSGSSSIGRQQAADSDAPSGLLLHSDRTQHVEVRSSTVSGKRTESSKATAIRTKDIIKIFTDDSNYVDVSSEQVERIKVMHERMEEGCTFTFNYNTLLLVASVLAGLGLVSNSSATIIASMLVSPLMGPVVGLAYGSTIRDWRLVRKSFGVECVSLVFCIVMGMTIAAITGPTPLSDKWPTQEMYVRGTKINFYVALPIAFFSGLGVAVSLLDDQTASLVGVAISASLLPPAVNAGILWVAYFFAKHGDLGNICDSVRAANGTNRFLEERGLASWFNDGSLTCEELLTKYDQAHLQETTPDKYYSMGIISLFVTLANIALIWISSMLMFRMKEVLPIKKKVFWDDLGVARKIYQRRAMMYTEQYPLPEKAAEESKVDDGNERDTGRS